jgi:hypothetical protein
VIELSEKKSRSYKIMARLIAAEIKNNPSRKYTQGVWTDSTNKQYFCNGHLFIEFNTPVEGLLQLDDSITRLNPNLLFPKDYASYQSQYLADIADSIKDVKEESKTKGVKNPKDYLENSTLTKIGASWYSSLKLQDLLKILGLDTIVYNLDEELTPCVMVSGVGRAILAPVKRGGEDL